MFKRDTVAQAEIELLMARSSIRAMLPDPAVVRNARFCDTFAAGFLGLLADDMGLRGPGKAGFVVSIEKLLAETGEACGIPLEDAFPAACTVVHAELARLAMSCTTIDSTPGDTLVYATTNYAV